MSTTSSATARNFVPASSSPRSNRIRLLLEMARETEQLAAQAARIKELRKLSRKTGEGIAGDLGVSYRTYQRWEGGEGEINAGNIKKLAAYFGTTPDYIEYGTMKRDTPDPFNGTVESRLDAIEQKLEDVRVSQLALLAAIQELRKAQQQPSTSRRSTAK